MRILSLILSIIVLLSFSACGKNNSDSNPDSSAGDSVLSKEQVSEKVDFSSFEMTLVNSWNPIDEGVTPELSKIDEELCPDGLYIATVALEDLQRLHKAAKEEEMNLRVVSAWRSNTVQTSLFNKQVSLLKKANPSLDLSKIETQAAAAVPRPGTSEHELGLAVDFNSANDDFRSTREYHWLVANCTKYGFILRYDTDSTEKTGSNSKCWHFRYVGVDAAQLIEKSGLCLEEFIEEYTTFE